MHCGGLVICYRLKGCRHKFVYRTRCTTLLSSFVVFYGYTHKGCPTVTILFPRYTITKINAKMDTRVDTDARTHTNVVSSGAFADSITRSAWASARDKMAIASKRNKREIAMIYRSEDNRSTIKME